MIFDSEWHMHTACCYKVILESDEKDIISWCKASDEDIAQIKKMIDIYHQAEQDHYGVH